MINCLINFLTDRKQKALINMIQNRDETFEHALDSYKKLFLVEKEHCLGRWAEEAQIGEIENFCHNEDCYFHNACIKVFSVVCKIDCKRIETFFDGIRWCYMQWIDSQPAQALDAFDSLLKEYKLINNEPYDESGSLLMKDITSQVFFRARVTNEFLGKFEMFHVPYNKRYNLRNERFSLTGQPLLYLGNSIADVVEELDINLDDKNSIENLKVSSFELLDTSRERKIFDLRCNIWQNIRDDGFTEEIFFRNILSIICSFQKRKGLEGYAFKEEYVIPQMFAHVR